MTQHPACHWGGRSVHRATSVPKNPVLYYWMHWCVVCLSSCLMGRRGVVGRTTEDQPWSKGDFQWSVPAPQAKLYSRDKILLNGVTNRKLAGEKSTCRNCNGDFSYNWFLRKTFVLHKQVPCLFERRIALICSVDVSAWTCLMALLLWKHEHISDRNRCRRLNAISILWDVSEIPHFGAICQAGLLWGRV